MDAHKAGEVRRNRVFNREEQRRAQALEELKELMRLEDNDFQWHDEAACKGLPSDTFFLPIGGSPQRKAAAVAVCNTCPVKKRCLDWAINNHVTHGIWGGKSERERRIVARSRGIIIREEMQ
jgi:WhiB family redox-sensing transcriptional regulator